MPDPTPMAKSTSVDSGASSPSSGSGLNTPNIFHPSAVSPSLAPMRSNKSGFLPASSSSYQEDWEVFSPLDRLTVFDLLDNLALPQRLERLQQKLSAQTEKVRRQQEKIKSSSINAKERVVEEWRRRVPPPDEQLEKYRRKMRDSVDRLGRRWNDTKVVTMREKIAFMAGILNILVSGYLIGAFPQGMPIWYTLQLFYFLPIRAYTYHRRGYHYFLADLCYFVNLMAVLSLWFFPRSKRLFMSTYCLAYGNNAVAIAMWRNSLVLHSLDKITSLFIHIMPPVTLHCIVHLVDPDVQRLKFPAVYAIRESLGGGDDVYSLRWMALWATVPYAVWQLTYHTLITVRRREKIAAGRPTSFTWLRKSYSKSVLGRAVLALPQSLQESAFMLIQYSYALVTMLPCPLWFRYRWLSAAFLLIVFAWSVYNGATYYIDVFGKRFQNELEQLRSDVAKWQNSPEVQTPTSPESGARLVPEKMAEEPSAVGTSESSLDADGIMAGHQRSSSMDDISLLDGKDSDGLVLDSKRADSTTGRSGG
ncbi:MAG: hypothetical protein M1815_001253 [Lichina confinis]|nr:MAG: hypothetical protein M1815_001253 [Lichina confinis]